MTPQDRFEKWWDDYELQDPELCFGDIESAFLAGRESGLQEAAEVAMYEAGMYADEVSAAILRLKEKV